jgi:hypothetical protein
MLACKLTSLVLVVNLLYLSIPVEADFLIDQRFKEENKIRPPPNPFFNTFYDKSYYLTGAQRPVYNVIYWIKFLKPISANNCFLFFFQI